MSAPLDSTIADILAMCDEVSPLSDMERQIYWVVFKGGAGTTATLIINALHRTTGITVRCGDGGIATSLRIEPTTSLRVLDQARRVIEVIGKAGSSHIRCVLAPAAETVMEATYRGNAEPS